MLLLLLTLASPVLADDIEVPKAHELRLDSGFFGAGGIGGVSLGFAPIPQLLVEGGLAYGISHVQVSIMPRLVLGPARTHFLFGVGLATGIGSQGSYVKGFPTWLDIEAVGFEHRFAGGLVILIAAGFMYGLGGGKYCNDCYPGDDPADTEQGSIYATGRLGIGYAF